MMNWAQQRRLSVLLLNVGPLTSLAITPMWNYDPINPIKVLIISVFGFAALGVVLPNFKYIVKNNPKLMFVLTFFLLALTAPLVLADGPLSQQIWGVFGRGTGFLAYFSLACILLCTAILGQKTFYQNLINALIFTSYIMTFYCLIQIAGLDPFSWSAFDTFGTLGNVNFLSAFLGMSSIALSIKSFDSNYKPSSRIAYISLAILQLSIIWETDSIQGLMLYGFGISLFLGFLVAKKGKIWIVSYLSMMGGLFTAVVMALFNRGPLASLIYQETIAFRADYMQAGLKMMLKNPFYGVGIDSYGDWYRAERGAISAFRTAFNRTANSAHNIFIDLGASGGFPLLIAYLLIQLLAARSVLRRLSRRTELDFTFITIATVWFGYQVQATVSINQIGVGIWGWLFAGALIGYESVMVNLKSPDLMKRKSNRDPSTLPASSALSAISLSLLGFAFAFVPLKMDYDFRQNSNKGDLLAMMNTSKSISASAFFIAKTAESAAQNGYSSQSREMTDLLITKFPRDYYGWQLRSLASDISAVDRSLSYRRMGDLDPYSTICLRSSAVEEMRNVLLALPREKQAELMSYWRLAGISAESWKRADFSIHRVPEFVLLPKIKSFCGIA
jgi:hypothetical protein